MLPYNTSSYVHYKHYMSTVWSIELLDELQDGTLPISTWTNNSHSLAWFNYEVELVKNLSSDCNIALA